MRERTAAKAATRARATQVASKVRSGSLADDDVISGGTCTIAKPTPCVVKVAVGVAADAAKENGGSNAKALQALKSTLEHGGNVSLNAAKRELGTWVRETQASRSAPANDKRWAATISEALSLDA